VHLATSGNDVVLRYANMALKTQVWVKESTTRYETTKFYKVKADSSNLPYLYFVVRSDYS